MIKSVDVSAMTISLADFLEVNEHFILKRWEEHGFVQEVLRGHDIEPSFFINHFGSRVLDYFRGVLRGENEPGSCPAITALLMFFRQKEIKLNEIFLCCAAFKNTVIFSVMKKHGGITEEELDIITFVFDLNFSGVISEYLQKRFCKLSCDVEGGSSHSLGSPVPQLHEVQVKAIQKTQVYESEYEQEDIDEFFDLEVDILSLTDQLDFGEFSEETLSQLAVKLSKYGSIILTNHNFNDIGNSVIHLAQQFEKSENHPFIRENIKALVVFVDCFLNDLMLWRKSLLETGIADPHYYDRSIISNVEQIISMINGHTDIDEGEGFEFF